MAITARNIAVGLALFGVLMMGSAPANASSLSFYVDWSGADFSNTAEARGILTVNDALFPNTSNDLLWLAPGNQVTDFSLTISGANSGNGSFQLTDFGAFFWDTKATLDFSQELVGQYTEGGWWGSTHDGATGEFNFISADEFTYAPTALNFFSIKTSNGLGDSMSLVSFRPVPLPGAVWLFGSVLAGLLGLERKRRTVQN